MKHIIVATDGSENASRAVDVGAELAAKLDARLTIVAVAPEPTTLARQLEPYARAEGLENDLPRLLASVEPVFMEPARQRARARGVKELKCCTLAGDPAGCIVDFAREGAADLLVVGSRGHGRLGGLLLGSVSQKLASHAPCPVLIAR